MITTTINNKALQYKESLRAILALENNPNVDILSLEKRLHDMHVSLMQDIQEFCQETLMSWERTFKEEDLLFITSLLFKGFTLIIEKPSWRREYDDPSIYLTSGDNRIELSKDGEDYENFIIELYHLEECVFFQEEFDYDDYSKGWSGPDPIIEESRDIEKEEYIKSLGLIPKYIESGTYHSRSITLIAVRSEEDFQAKMANFR